MERHGQTSRQFGEKALERRVKVWYRELKRKSMAPSEEVQNETTNERPVRWVSRAPTQRGGLLED